MKNQLYKYIFLSVVLFGCHRGGKSIVVRNDDGYSSIKNTEQCFVAVYQKDSAVLQFKTMPNGKIKGKLVISYSELEPLALKREFYHGEITGRFTKDTLFADYIFADRDEGTIYRNPMALLKKGGKLMLGVGAIENYLGRTWFINHREISFNKCRFQFEPAECMILPRTRPMH